MISPPRPPWACTFLYPATTNSTGEDGISSISRVYAASLQGCWWTLTLPQATDFTPRLQTDLHSPPGGSRFSLVRWNGSCFGEGDTPLIRNWRAEAVKLGFPKTVEVPVSQRHPTSSDGQSMFSEAGSITLSAPLPDKPIQWPATRTRNQGSTDGQTAF